MRHPGSVIFGIAVCFAGVYSIAKLWTNPQWTTTSTNPAAVANTHRVQTWATVGVLAVVGVFGVWNVVFGLTDKPTTYVGPSLPDGGYENPAPGNDGSYDCAPGQGPVYVGANDPAGLDADGDGIGCE